MNWELCTEAEIMADIFTKSANPDEPIFVSPEEALKFETRKALYPVERVNSTGALAPNRRVAAKGVMIPGSPARINLTSVVVLSESCSASTAN